MWFSLLRDTAENFRVHSSSIRWALRYELGEVTQRPHFHALVAGLPASAANVATCFSIMRTWEKHGGGQARVRVYDSTLAGVEYILKGVDEAYFSCGNNWYELGKFGGRCSVTLSVSLSRHLHNRKRLGHRGRDGLYSFEQPSLKARRRQFGVNLNSAGDESRRIDTLATRCTGQSQNRDVRTVA
jgi:hypothetical protein